ncbi:MAG: hypothetical protein GX127_06925 [Eubacteriaceae bacterium]|jgi:hypothetical protein|nr:hypothetical protein [Eubacteriaceae bacterium]
MADFDPSEIAESYWTCPPITGDPCLTTKLEVLLPDLGAFGYPRDRCALAGTIRNGSTVANPFYHFIWAYGYDLKRGVERLEMQTGWVLLKVVLLK